VKAAFSKDKPEGYLLFNWLSASPTYFTQKCKTGRTMKSWETLNERGVRV